MLVLGPRPKWLLVADHLHVNEPRPPQAVGQDLGGRVGPANSPHRVGQVRQIPAEAALVGERAVVAEDLAAQLGQLHVSARHCATSNGQPEGQEMGGAHMPIDFTHHFWPIAYCLVEVSDVNEVERVLRRPQ